MDVRIMLVVDDHAWTRQALRGIFRRKGYLLREAATVAEGLEFLSPPPHCIILDSMLPDGNGEAVLRKVREEKLPTRVVVCTGTHDADRLASLVDWQPEALLYKPIDVRNVLKVCDML